VVNEKIICGSAKDNAGWWEASINGGQEFLFGEE
jgi:hypothetical protein